MTPYDSLRAWDIAVYTEYISSYDGICQVVRIPDVRYPYVGFRAWDPNRQAGPGSDSLDATLAPVTCL